MFLQFATFLGKAILEPFGGGMVRHSSLHAHIHAGKAYNGMVSGESVAAGESLLLQLKIPDGLVVHFKNVELFTTGSSKRIKLIENPTSVTDGTAVVPFYNRKREPGAVASPVQAFSDPADIVGGTELRNYLFGSGSNQFGAMGVSSDREWLLIGPLVWIFELVNEDSQAAEMYVDADYYLN